MKRLLCILFVLAGSPAVAASDLPPGPKRFVGAWRMGHDGEGSRTCTVRLDAAGVIGGARLRAPKNCQGVVDRWSELFAWYVNADGQLVMADATRKAIYRFHRLEQGLWASEGGDFDRYLLYYQPVGKR